MARPLMKCYKSGEAFKRLPSVEKCIDAALNQDLDTLRTRLQVQDRHSQEFVPSECLVHLIRHALRTDDGVSLDVLLPVLFGRCEANLKAKIADGLPDAAGLREDILGQFAELLASDGTGDNPDALDYYEVRFNAAFRAFRIDKYKQAMANAEIGEGRTLRLPEPENDEPSSGDELYVMLSGAYRVPATQESALILRQIVEAVNALPPEERDAVVYRHFMGYEVESDNPAKCTVATLCNVTGRTVRNRLKSAAKKLSQFKEHIQ